MLYAPLPKSNLQTFGNLLKSRTVKSTATAVVVKADRGLFARMVVTAHLCWSGQSERVGVAIASNQSA